MHFSNEDEEIKAPVVSAYTPVSIVVYEES